MLAEVIMDVMGWTDVWALGRNGLTRHPFRDTAVMVGVWTGPQHDLLCVRRCETNLEAEAWLAPGGRTILHAIARSLVLYFTGPLIPHCHLGHDARPFRLELDPHRPGCRQEFPVCWCIHGSRRLKAKEQEP